MAGGRWNPRTNPNHRFSRAEAYRRSLFSEIAKARPKANGKFLSGSVTSSFNPVRNRWERALRRATEQKIITIKKQAKSSHPQNYQSYISNSFINPVNRNYNNHLINSKQI